MPKKRRTKAEREHLSRLAELGCMACRVIGYDDSPAEIHHKRSGMGLSQRSSDYEAIPLCPAHHRSGGPGVAYHAGPAAFEKRYGTEDALLAQTRELLRHRWPDIYNEEESKHE